MDKWFGDAEIGLSAEHGCYYKHPTSIQEEVKPTNPEIVAEEHQWYRLVNQVDTSWRDIIRPLFRHYTERTPGSFIEEKEINLTWHYRNADPEFGSWQAAELQVNLEKLLSHMAVSVSFEGERKERSVQAFHGKAIVFISSFSIGIVLVSTTPCTDVGWARLSWGIKHLNYDRRLLINRQR